MIEPNEIVMLLLGLALVVFIRINRAGLRHLPASGTILAAFYALLGSMLATVLEGLLWNDFFNLLEHSGLAVSSVLTAAWSWKVFADGGKKE